MVLVALTSRVRVTDRGIKLAGMRAAATGSVDLTGVVVDEEALIGEPGDYLREPAFSTEPGAVPPSHSVVSVRLSIRQKMSYARVPADNSFTECVLAERDCS